MKTIAFFNNKGGVGKTTLVYHLAWMLADMGHKVIAADLDPQSNLTSMFLDEDRLSELWSGSARIDTAYGIIEPIMSDIQSHRLASIDVGPDLVLMPGDLALSEFEDRLAAAWALCQHGDESAFRAVTAFYRAILLAAEEENAEMVLIDVGPNLGAINRAALLAAQYVVIPLAADLYSLRGLSNLGSQLKRWRAQWHELRGKSPDPDLPLPSRATIPAGYVVMQHDSRARASRLWMKRIPGEYRQSVMDQPEDPEVQVDNDPYCLAALKNYRSLMPLAMEARKPMFHLKPADGAIGAHAQAVQDCETDFRHLAMKILEAVEEAVEA
jgi:chromosome partitioning protein